MGDGGSGAEFHLVCVVVAASPDGSVDAAAAAEEEEEKEAAILLVSDTNETRMGRACGSTVHFGRGLMVFLVDEAFPNR